MRNSGLQPQSRPLRHRQSGRGGARAPRSQRDVEGRHGGALRHGLLRRRAAPRLRHRRRRVRLANLEGARRRHREGPGRRGALGQVQRRLLLQGREGLLLLPLRRASRGGEAHRGQPEPEGLVPRHRHPPGRRRPRLRAPGPAGVEPPGHGERRRALAGDPARKGTNPESGDLRAGPRHARLEAGADAGQDGRRLRLRRRGGRHLLLPHRPGRAPQAARRRRPGPGPRRRTGGRSSPRPRGPTCCATSPRWATGSSRSGCAT